MADREPLVARVLATLLGLNRAGKILWPTLFVGAVSAFVVWNALLPRLGFGENEERLFGAARHGDVAGIERALGAGASVDKPAPIDSKTALFRAAVFGHADAVRILLARGANPSHRGNDGQTALEVVQAVRAEEKNKDRTRSLDAVAAALKGGTAPQ